MVKISNNALPWIFLSVLLLLRLIGILMIMFWPPTILYDYALRARACQNKRTEASLDPKNILSITLWNHLTSIINVCSYNPELIINEFQSKTGLRIFHMSNRNLFITSDECTIVSVNNAMHADAEEELATASKCKFYASDYTIQTSSTYHTDSAPWKVILDPNRDRKPRNESSAPKPSYSYWEGGALTTDLRSLLVLKFAVQNVDNLIIGPFDHNREFRDLLWPSFYKTYASRFCQVNIVYQRMGLVSLTFFLKSFHDILYAGSFFIIKTSKSTNNKYMNLYAVNFMEPHCIERYLKPTVEFQTKI